ncbi:hypothetical protein [Patulibacter minatonensis]|uniref:hypothetical protein n=1 Tax=Patulibacter minatonensis TaxID=298163 RepID=UPI00047AEB52|nr:hypothetical protein [Patulibacter minatonensis]
MRIPGRILLAATTATLGVALAGCGGSDGGTSCTDSVCTVQSDGPGSFDIDQLSTKVTLSDLSADSVVVRINADRATIRRDADPVRMRGFLVTAPETGPDRAKVRIER